ncbi:MAG: DUF4256 domain-containing protein, partial [Chitinophagaceae bacterium]
MVKKTGGKLSAADTKKLIDTLKLRFEKNASRHRGIEWKKVEEHLNKNAGALSSLYELEQTGGEPDVVAVDKKSGEIIFMDCAAESPSGRRSLCFDEAALEARKEAKPSGSAVEMAKDMGVEILTEEEYRFLQTLGDFDLKTSSWVQTPSDIRKAGGALFCDKRYGHVFLYHNGAQSYYAA